MCGGLIRLEGNGSPAHLCAVLQPPSSTPPRASRAGLKIPQITFKMVLML